jgi:hypothetical protein
LSVASVTQSAGDGVVEIVGNQVRYTPNVKFLNGLDTFTYTAKDAAGLTTGPTTVTVTVNTFNDAPGVDVGANQPALSVDENKAAGSSAGFATAKDQEGNAVLNWTITGGTGQSLFSINKFTGEITTAASFDFEATTSYTLTLTAQDSAGLTSAAGTVTVSVNNVNEAPSITSGATASAAENQTGAYTATATDPDAGTTLAYTLTGADKDLFDVSNTGVVTFKAAPNFEAAADAGADNVYNFTVNASDGTNTATVSTLLADQSAQ